MRNSELESPLPSASARLLAGLLLGLVGACVTSNPAWDPPAETDSDEYTGDGALDSGTGPDSDSGPDSGPNSGPDSGSDSETGHEWTGGSGDDDPSGGEAPGDGDPPGDGDGDGDEPVYACDEAAESYGPCPAGCDECHAGICWRFCGEGECHDDFMLCPVSWSCRVVCLGKDSCKNATVACTGWGTCEVACMGDSACMDADILCSAGPCEVTCGGGQDKPCEHTEVWCGGNETRIHCEDPYAGAGPKLTPTQDHACACTSDCEPD